MRFLVVVVLICGLVCLVGYIGGCVRELVTTTAKDYR